MNGIDVSYFQETINWDLVKPNIDFAMIRAGYGKNNIDIQASRNVSECQRLNIPWGLYWFSYALSPEMARKEADYVLDFVGDKKVPFPIAYDFEYASERYCGQNGVKPNRNFVLELTDAFCSRLEEKGFYAVFYCNNDFYLKYYQSSKVSTDYDMWFARYNTSPGRKCGMWQKSESGVIPGIKGKVDLDVAYHNYPVIMDKNDLNNYK